MEYVGFALVVVMILLIALIVRQSRLLGRVAGLEARLPDRRLAEAVEGLPGRVVGPVGESVSRAAADAVADLSDRIDALRERVEEIGRREADAPPAGPRLAEEVGPLLEEAVDSLEARIRELAASLQSRRDEGIAAAIARELAGKGFADVEIVDGPAFEGERTRVVVSARREGMPFKGVVFLSGQRIVEDRLSPAWPMFP